MFFFSDLQTSIKLSKSWGHWGRNVQNNSLTVWHGRALSFFSGGKKKLQVDISLPSLCVSCSVSITHQGLSREWANNMQACCEIRALQDRGEIGWLVLHSGNCSRPRLPDTGRALCINWSHIRSRDGRGRGSGLSASPWRLCCPLCLRYAAILHSITWPAISRASHASYCLKKKKNVTSQQRSANNGAGRFTQENKAKEDVFFFCFVPRQLAGIRWL